MLSNLLGWLEKPQPLGETERLAIGQAVALVDPLLKMVSGYEHRLAPAVRHALAYCDGLAAAVPGPIDLNSPAFASDPLIHALFATVGDIGAILGKSKALKEYLADPAGAAAENFYALLGMRRFEKKVMGMSMHGEMVIADTPQNMLYFSDHTLHALASDQNETRTQLRRQSFDSLTMSFAAQVADQRRERQSLHDEWDMQRALSARDRRAGAEAPGKDHARLCEELELRLQQASARLSPERILDDLISWLAAPEIHLRLDQNTVSVDRMGVIVDAASTDPQVSTLNFPELIGRDRRHWIVLIARIPYAEARRAVERQQEAGRYLII